jgi:hypothetical protein
MPENFVDGPIVAYAEAPAGRTILKQTTIAIDGCPIEALVILAARCRWNRAEV